MLKRLSDKDLLEYKILLEKQKQTSNNRSNLIKKYQYDTKLAYHIVRLLNQVEQLLVEGDMNLQRPREQLKAIRRGEWTKEQVKQYFADKESQLEKIYNESKVLPYKPREREIKQLLIDCLEHHYGDLSSVMNLPDKYQSAVLQIKNIINDIS